MASDAELNEEMSVNVALIVNRLFNNEQQSFISHPKHINACLVQLIEIVRSSYSFVAASPQHRSHTGDSDSLLYDALFAMIFNLNKQKLAFQSERKYLDLCIMNDMAELLVDYLGKLTQINTVMSKELVSRLHWALHCIHSSYLYNYYSAGRCSI